MLISFLFFFLTLLFNSNEILSKNGDYSVSAIKNLPLPIRLTSYYQVNPGSVVNLPIDVPKQVFSINGKAPPILRSISSPNTTGNYIVGDQLHIHLNYYDRVEIFNDIELEVNTGCNSHDCVTPEEQSFTCKAEMGMFSINLDNEFIMNIQSSASPQYLKEKLEELNSINRVTVSSHDILTGLESTTLCTKNGVKTRIKFNSVYFPQYNGDVPQLKLNYLNNDGDLRTHLSQGIELNKGYRERFGKKTSYFLEMMNPKEKIYLDPEAIEDIKGENRTNGIAYYLEGNSTEVLTFVYIINYGDIVSSLDIVNIDYKLDGYINSVYGENVTTILPKPGFGSRYMSSSPSSLSYNLNLAITTAIPKVINIDSWNASSTYTAGDTLYIEVIFDSSVSISNPELFTFELKTSLFSKLLPFYTIIDNRILVFIYNVDTLDGIALLEYMSINSLKLNGGKIFRVSSSGEVNAIITLPPPYTPGSLSSNKNIVINTQTPVIINLEVLSPAKVYTAGDLITFSLKFSTSVYVEGTPFIPLENQPRLLEGSILTAPYNPSFSYRRSWPDGISQINFNIKLNFDLKKNEIIQVTLPSLYLRQPTSNERIVSLNIISQSSDDAIIEFQGEWNENEKSLYLATLNDIPSYTLINLFIEAQTSIFIDPFGLNQYGNEYITINTPISPLSTFQIPFQIVQSVGYETFSITYSTYTYSSFSLSLAITFPEDLTLGDILIVHLYDVYTWGPVITASSTVIMTDTTTGATYEVALTSGVDNPNISVKLISLASTSVNSISLNSFISLPYPEMGLNKNDLKFSLDSVLNGKINNAPVPQVENLCGIPSQFTSVTFLGSRPGYSSDIKFRFFSHSLGYSVGDEIDFVLSTSVDPSFSTLSSFSLTSVNYLIKNYYLTGDYLSNFEVYYSYISATNIQIKFKVISSIPKEQQFELILSKNFNVIIPSNGVTTSDSYTVSLTSNFCLFSTPRVLNYLLDSQIIYPSNLAFTYTPSTSLSFSAISTALSFSANFPRHDLNENDLILFYANNLIKDIDHIITTITVTTNPVLSPAMTIEANFLSNNSTLQIELLRSLPANTIISFYIPETSTFTTNSEGFSSSYSLSVYTENSGILVDYPFSGGCYGFCTASLDYNSFIEDDEFILTLKFKYSLAIGIGSNIQLTLPGFEIDTAYTYSIGTATSPSYISFSSATFNSGTEILNFITNSNLAASSDVTITISGLKLTSTAQNGTPTLKFGSAVYTFDPPSQLLPSMIPLHSSFSIYSITNNGFILGFTLKPTQDLLANNYISVDLTGFTKTNFEVTLDNIITSDDIIDLDKSFFNSQSNILNLVINQYINPGSYFTINIDGFAPPPGGIFSLPNDVSFSFGKDILTSSTSSKYATRFIPFDDQVDSIAFSNADIDMTLNLLGADNLEVTSLTFSFTSSSQLAANYNLELKLPFFERLTPTIINSGGYSFEWQPASKSFLIPLPTDISISNISFTIPLSGFTISSSGISNMDLATLIFSDDSSNVLSQIQFNVDCIGVCTASVRGRVANPGRATTYDLNVSLGTYSFNPGDSIEFKLTDYSTLFGISSTLLCTSPDSIYPFLLEFTSLFPFSSLVVTNPSTGTGIGLFSFSCVIPEDTYLIQPLDGIRISTLFDIDINYISTSYPLSFTSNLLEVANVGSASVSKFAISPLLPSSKVNLDIKLEFLDDLQIGDILYVYLPSFSLPKRFLSATSNKLVEVESFPPVKLLKTNLDQSTYYENVYGYLKIKLNENLLANELLELTFDTNSEIITPYNGISLTEFPFFTSVSSTSPIAGFTFQDVTQFVSFNPASIILEEINTDNYLSANSFYYTYTFTILCPLSAGDKIRIKNPLLEALNNGNLNNVYIESIDTNLITLSSSWDNSLKETVITITSGSISSDTLSFVVSYHNFKLEQQVVYYNDDIFSYLVVSSTCNVYETPFSLTSNRFLKSSSVNFNSLIANPVELSFNVEFETLVNLMEGDIIQIEIKNLIYGDECTTNEPDDYVFSSVSSHIDTSQISLSNDCLNKKTLITVLLTQDINKNSTITFGTSINDEKGFHVIDIDYFQNILFSFVRPSTETYSPTFFPTEIPSSYPTNYPSSYPTSTPTSSPTSFPTSPTSTPTSFPTTITDIPTSSPSTAPTPLIPIYHHILFKGIPQQVNTIPTILSAVVTINNPIPNERSQIEVTWILSSTLTTTSTLKLYLPEFFIDPSIHSGIAPLTWTYSSIDALQQYSLTWNPSSYILEITPIIDISSTILIYLDIPYSIGFTNPTKGYPPTEDSLSTISLYSNNIFLGSFETDLTIVAQISFSSVSFISSDSADLFSFDGDYKALHLMYDHEFDEHDDDMLIVIDNSVYTIQSVDTDNDILYIKEDYTGRRVLINNPDIDIYSNDYVYAHYTSGSGTSDLIFTYKVTHADESSVLSLKSFGSGFKVDLSKGKILRQALVPTIPINPDITLFINNNGRSVSTSIPYIISITTTSPPGIYSVDQFFDLEVTFSTSVTLIQEFEFPKPKLILEFPNGEYQEAYYSSGSGTNKLYFLYQIKEDDIYHPLLNDVLSSTSYSDNQPLRIIVGNGMSFLKRTSDNPHIDANIFFDLDVVFLSDPSASPISAPYSWQHSAPKVISVEVYSPQDELVNGETKLVYAPGEYIYIKLTINDDIRVLLDPLTEELPTIELDMGQSQPGIAYLFEDDVNIATNELRFRYLVLYDDNLDENGLVLTCTCLDYLKRTFLTLNGATIESETNNLPMSLIIADSPDIFKRIINSAITIDYTVPTVEAISSNSTNFMYTPGDSILINVTFSHPIFIEGLVSINLQGQFSSCRASYLYGNSTNVISFLYHVSFYSGISRFECDFVNNFDTSTGSFYRFAPVPTILSDLTLTPMRLSTTLGLQNEVSIDSSIGKINNIKIDTETNYLLAVRSLGFNYVDNLIFKDLYESCGCESWMLQDSNSISDQLQQLEQVSNNDLTFTHLSSALHPSYRRFLLESYYPQMISRIPSFVAKCFNWWVNYDITSTMEFIIEYDRSFKYLDTMKFQINTGPGLNSVYSINRYRQYILKINVLPTPSLDRYFAFEYGGRISQCLSLSVQGNGISSIQESLQNIAGLQQQDVHVILRTMESDRNREYFIQFQYSLPYELKILTGRDAAQVCDSYADADEIYLISPKNQTTFVYNIRPHNSILINSIDAIGNKEDTPPGEYRIEVSGLKINEFSLDSNSIISEHASYEGEKFVQSSVVNNDYPRILSSALSFSSTIPSYQSFLGLNLCFSKDLLVNDKVIFKLPDYTLLSNNLVSTDYTSFWDSSTNELTFTLLNGLSCIIIDPTLEEISFQNPPFIIYSNDKNFVFSLVTASSINKLVEFPFERVTPLGFSNVSIEFTNPNPGRNTDIIFKFNLLNTLKSVPNIPSSLLDYTTDKSQIIITIPHFTTSSIGDYNVQITGKLHDRFSAIWSDSINAFIITIENDIPAGEVALHLKLIEASLIYSNYGLVHSDPPTIQVKGGVLYDDLLSVVDSEWSAASSDIKFFDSSLGFNSIDASFNLDSNYNLNSIVLSLDLFQNFDSSYFVLQLPFIHQKDGYFKLIGTPQGVPSIIDFTTAEWFGFNSSFVINIDQSISANTLYTLTLDNLIDFKLTEGLHADVEIKDTSLSIFPYHMTDNLYKYPIKFTTSVPYIYNSRIQLLNLEQRVFYEDLENLNIYLNLSHIPEVSDEFKIKLLMSPIFLDLSTVTIVDTCYSISNIVSVPNTYIEFSIQLNPTCTYDLNLFIPLSNVEIIESNVYSIPYNTEWVYVKWINSDYNMDYRLADSSPILGYYSSKLIFDSPYFNANSESTLKIMTSTYLFTKDKINLKLTGFSMPLVNNNDCIIYDNHNNKWNCNWDSTNQLFSMTAGKPMTKTNLIFYFTDETILTLPSSGLSTPTSSVYLYFSITGPQDTNNPLITLPDTRTLLPSPIEFITPVGFLNHECRIVNLYQDNYLSCQFNTLSPLDASDKIHLSFTSLEFNPLHKVNPLTSSDLDMRELYTPDENHINIYIFERQLTSTYLINDYIIDGFHLTGGPSISVSASIDSTINPASNVIGTVKTFLSSSGQISGKLLTLSDTQLIFPSQLNPLFKLLFKFTITVGSDLIIPQGSTIQLDLSSLFTSVSGSSILSDPSESLLLSNLDPTWDLSTMALLLTSTSDITLTTLNNIFEKIIYFDSVQVINNNQIYQNNELEFPLKLSLMNSGILELTQDISIKSFQTLGLKSSTLEINGISQSQDEFSSLSITLIGDFIVSDIVEIELPFLNSISSSLVAFSSISGASVSYIEASNKISFTFTSAITSIALDVSLINDQLFTLPSQGINSVSNNPTLVYISSILYGPFNFDIFHQISPKSELTLSYNKLIAGEEAELKLLINSEAHINILNGEVWKLFLPQFFYQYSSVYIEILSMSPSITINKQITGKWDSCKELLEIKFNEDLLFDNIFPSPSSLELLIKNIRLPPFGVLDYVTDSISISSSKIFLNYKFDSVMLTNYIMNSYFDIPSTSTLGSTFPLKLGFELSSPLATNDVVYFNLNGLVIDVGCSMVPTTDFSVFIDPSSFLIELTSLNDFDALNKFEVEFTNCVTISNTGFPANNPSSGFTLSVNSIFGYIGETQIQQIPFVGLKKGKIYYEIKDIMDAVEIRIELEFTYIIDVNDYIEIYLPYLVQHDTSVPIEIVGDFLPDNYISYFSASFDSFTKILRLTAIKQLSDRIFNVFITRSSKLYIDNVASSATHQISANIASLGLLSPITISHTPSIVSPLREPKIQLSDCDASYNCKAVITFSLTDTLNKDDVIIFSHPHFVGFDPSTFSYTSSFLSGGSGWSNNFYLSWRQSDTVNGVEITSPNLEYINPPTSIIPDKIVEIGSEEYNINYEFNIEQTGFFIDSNEMVLPINPSFSNVVEKKNFNIVINGDVPRVRKISLKKTHTPLIIGDDLFIDIVFTKPVFVSDEEKVKVLLNTGELANYYSGSNTDTLTFKYYLINPINVAVLSVAGASALEISSFGNVFDSRYLFTSANLTIPEPFELSISDSSSLDYVEVDTSVSSSILNVYAFHGANSWHSTGDIIDIAVEFSRPVKTIGEPEFILSIDTFSDELVAKFVNVTKFQYLELSPSGFFQLHYKSSNTECISVDNLDKIKSSIELIPELKESLPLKIDQLSYSESFLYNIYFEGIPPELLTISFASCSLRAEGRIYMDPDLYNTVIFRYEVQDDDPSGLLTYSTVNSLVFDDNNYIKVYTALDASDIKVNPLLPSPTDPTLSLIKSNVIINNAHPTILSIRSDFFTVNNRDAINGDSIYIEVTFSDEIIAYGDIFFPLHVSNDLENVDNNPLYYRKAPLYSFEGNKIVFLYYVEMGDYTPLLDIPSWVSQIIIEGDGYIRRKSRSPTIDIVNDLLISDNLTQDTISVQATSLPIILSATVQNAPIEATIGMNIVIEVKFSSIVNIVIHEEDGELLKPEIVLMNPPGAKIYYIGGSGTDTLLFEFTVELQFGSGNVQFEFELLNAHLLDLFNIEFDKVSGLLTVDGLIIDTSFPMIKRVDCNCEDGIYYPGQLLNLFIVFDKPVVMSTGSNPSFELSIPSHERVLTNYTYGNGSYVLHFDFTVPEPNKFYSYGEPFKLNYAGVVAFKTYLNGALITGVPFDIAAMADIHLPTLDLSYLSFNRDIRLDFTIAHVTNVFLTQIFQPEKIATDYNFYNSEVPFYSGQKLEKEVPLIPEDRQYITAGDTIIIGVKFNTRIMVLHPTPIMILNLGTYARSAEYLTGNRTTTLFFQYTIQQNDNSEKLDYIDTRYQPYDSIDLSNYYSIPIITKENYLKNQFMTTLANVMMLSEKERIHVPLWLPLPGQLGSISSNYPLQVDTSLPQIRKVITLLPSGTYSNLYEIPIVLTYSTEVLVGGCPRILFYVNNQKRYAEYQSGSGTRLLHFLFKVEDNDRMVEFDYYDTKSLKLYPCDGKSFNSTELYIMRMAENPTIHANLTLPWVKYVESITSPSSIVGSGNNITLSGNSYYPYEVTLIDPQEVYTFGDTIKVLLRFNGEIEVLNNLNSLLLTDFSSSSHVPFNEALFTKQVTITDLYYEYVVGPFDINGLLSYNGTSALNSEGSVVKILSEQLSGFYPSCIFQDKNINFCASQWLPLVSSSGDKLTPANSKIELVSPPEVIDIYFFYENTMNYPLENIFSTGDKIELFVKFDTSIEVIGQPSIKLRSNDNTILPILLNFERLESSDKIAVFTRTLSSTAFNGEFVCSYGCTIQLDNNGGRGMILRRTNFLSFYKSVPTFTKSFFTSCSLTSDETCVHKPSTTINSLIPYVEKVYSNTTSIFSLGDYLYFFVQFSTPVKVVGYPVLQLDLSNQPEASYVSVTDDFKSIIFRYRVSINDFTSNLDYLNINSLYFNDDLTSEQGAGIFLKSNEVSYKANLVLPLRGELNSLGRESNIIINQNRPDIVLITVTSNSAMCGDVLTYVLKYSTPMKLIQFADNAVISDIKLSLNIKPNSNPLNKLTRYAEFIGIFDDELRFEYVVSSVDPLGIIEINYESPFISFLNTKYLLVSSLTEISVASQFSLDTMSNFDTDIEIVKIDPKIIDVYSTNTTTIFPMGVGDLLVVYIKFNVPIYIVDTSELQLELNFNNILRYATFSSLSSDKTVIAMKYIIKDDDNSNQLDYSSQEAFIGADNNVYQLSSCDVAVTVDVNLPSPGAENSLSYCCKIVVNSNPPFISSIFPLKMAGTYGKGEMILIVVRFSRPVKVYGNPILQLRVGIKDSSTITTSTTDVSSTTTDDDSINDDIYDDDSNDDYITVDEDIVVDTTSNYIIKNATFVTDVDALIRQYIFSYKEFIVGQEISQVISDSNIDISDLSIVITSSDLVFYYVVEEDDYIENLSHGGPNALILPEDTKILQLSDNPIYPADISLRYPGDYEITDGKISRQWLFGFPYKIEVMLRDIYHNKPSTLSAVVQRDGISSVLFQNCCKNNKFTRNTDRYNEGSLSNQNLKLDEAPIDILFSEAETSNIASSGRASQSSTISAADLAIDGDFSSLSGDGSISETIEEDNPYWRLEFTTPVQVESIRIYEREPQQWIPPIVSYTIKGLDRYPTGYYRLRFSNINKDSSIVVETDYIRFRAATNVVEDAIESLAFVGSVSVKKSLLPLCGLSCGSGFDSGYGDTYFITFTTITIPNPKVEIIDIKFPGEVLYPSENDPPVFEEDIEKFIIVYKISTTRTGYYKAIPKDYQGTSLLPESADQNKWLTPFWLFIFSDNSNLTYVDTPNYNLSIAKADWSIKIDSISKIRTIVLPRAFTTSIIKIQRVGYGALSLAEVEVFSQRLNILQSYNRGEKVQPYELNAPYNPYNPFKPFFGSTSYFGKWNVQLKQTSLSEEEKYENPHGFIGEAILIITDYAGVVHVYYQDLKAMVTSLPRFGRLFLSESNSVYNYGTWEDSFNVNPTLQIQNDPSLTRPLGKCYGETVKGLCYDPETRLYKTRQELTKQIRGDVPYFHQLRRERIAYYLPDPNFVGQDYFTFAISQGLTWQRIEGPQVPDGTDSGSLKVFEVGSMPNVNRVVSINVRKARTVLYDYLKEEIESDVNNEEEIVDNYYTQLLEKSETYIELIEPLCQCSSTSSSLIKDAVACEAARSDICLSTLTAPHFEAMCISCLDDTIFTSSSCRLNTIRAVFLLSLRGKCYPKPELKSELFEMKETSGYEEVSIYDLPKSQQGDVFSSSSSTLTSPKYISSQPLNFRRMKTFNIA